jgi:hypothetical protein
VGEESFAAVAREGDVMTSPFPGMDPYIESCGLWGDFHNALISQIYQSLADVAPERYFVRTGERSYHVVMETDEKSDRPFVLDVRITTPERGKKPSKRSGGATVAEVASEEEPLSLRAFLTEEHRETFVEIYQDDPELRLVTTIEVLSPSNKRPGTEGWKQYQRKRRSALLGGVNLVEIDLLRAEKRPPMFDAWPKCPYTLLVARAFHDQRCKVWRAYFQRPLPEIPVPLDEKDADLPLRLQPLIEAIYKRSRYGKSIDYGKLLDPPLKGTEATWLKARLREWQRSR